MIVVSEIGEQWSPQTAPARQAEIQTITIEGIVPSVTLASCDWNTPVTIGTTDWESGNSGYTYTWESDLVQSASEIEVFLRDGAENAGIEDFDVEKVTGGVQFTSAIQPTGNLPVTIRVINAKADAFQTLSGEDISTGVIQGAFNVDEALGVLDNKIWLDTNNFYGFELSGNNIIINPVTNRMALTVDNTTYYFTLTPYTP